MAARQPAVGIDHLTVVPSNFERAEATDRDDDRGEPGSPEGSDVADADEE